MSCSLLELRGAQKYFGPLHVINNVDLRLESGEIMFLVGPSGCGKTTLLRLIAGFETPDAGILQVCEETFFDATHFTPPKDRRLGYVPQEGVLFPHMSVYRNIAYGLGNGKGRTAAERKRIEGVMELTNISELADRKPHQISGGQQQRVALARALAPEPSIMLLDEPFSALDEHLRAQIRDDVIGILRRSNSSAIIVTHDRHEALSSADKVGIILDGRLVQLDTPKGIYRRPNSPEVARFMSEHGLMLDAKLESDGLHAFNELTGRVPCEIYGCTGDPARVGVCRGQLHIRSDQLVPTPPGEADALFTARIQNIQFHGNHSQIDLVARHTRISLDLGSKYADLEVGEQLGLRLVGKGIFYG